MNPCIQNLTSSKISQFKENLLKFLDLPEEIYAINLETLYEYLGEKFNELIAVIDEAKLQRKYLMHQRIMRIFQDVYYLTSKYVFMINFFDPIFEKIIKSVGVEKPSAINYIAHERLDDSILIRNIEEVSCRKLFDNCMIYLHGSDFQFINVDYLYEFYEKNFTLLIENVRRSLVKPIDKNNDYFFVNKKGYPIDVGDEIYYSINFDVDLNNNLLSDYFNVTNKKIEFWILKTSSKHLNVSFEQMIMIGCRIHFLQIKKDSEYCDLLYPEDYLSNAFMNEHFSYECGVRYDKNMSSRCQNVMVYLS
jgi:hypothetical protein